MKSKLLLFVCACTVYGASSETRLMRYPDISREAIVFDYAGDLWTAPRISAQVWTLPPLLPPVGAAWRHSRGSEVVLVKPSLVIGR